MKIAITGHTSGLGLGFHNFYNNLNHQVVGFSLSNGTDLRDWTQMQQMLDQISDVDIFINNAKPDFAQTVILYQLADRWKNTNKQIINIGSTIIDINLDRHIDIGINMYKTQKHALQNAFLQLFYKFQNLDSILVHPGHLYNNDRCDYQKIATWILKFETQRESAKQTQTRLGEIYLL